MNFTTTAVVAAVCVGFGIGALAAWWRGRSFWGWGIAAGLLALASPGFAAAGGIAALVMLHRDEDKRDSGFSLSDFSSDD